MAKWTLPEGRKPITTMDSADLVLRMHKKLAAGFAKGDRIAALEEMVEACKADAQEAEAYAAELEAKLAKAVEFTKGVIRHAGNSGDDYLAEQARTTLAELKGQDDE